MRDGTYRVVLAASSGVSPWQQHERTEGHLSPEMWEGDPGLRLYRSDFVLLAEPLDRVPWRERVSQPQSRSVAR